jgi:hypothetical protein
MNKGNLIRLWGALCCACLLIVFAHSTNAQDRSNREYLTGGYITGTVVGIGGQYAGRTGSFTLRINAYSTPDEVQQLQSALQSGGQDGLLNAMRKMEKGRLQVNNRVGVPVGAILATATETGTKLTIIYERTVRFYEMRYGARSQDYRFGYMELFVNRSGTGEGTLIPAARIRVVDNGTWEVENFGEFPARIIGVRARRR